MTAASGWLETTHAASSQPLVRLMTPKPGNHQTRKLNSCTQLKRKLGKDASANHRRDVRAAMIAVSPEQPD